MPINLQEFQKIQKNILNYNNTKLCVVTKTRDIEDVKKLISLGQKIFAENRVQEAEVKFSKIGDYQDVELHLIGPLQSNKVNTALNLFNCIQSIDRKKIIDVISQFSIKNKNIKTKEFYIQVNIGNEIQKSGVHKNSLIELYDYALKNNLNVKGLMCIPPNNQDPSIFFDELNELKNILDKKLSLSMGMSSDYETALEKGSNLVRIGSKIFT